MEVILESSKNEHFITSELIREKQKMENGKF